MVKMLFAPINPADLNIVQGSYPTQPALPAVAGSEGVGQVVEVGPNARNLKVGDLVLPLRQGLGKLVVSGSYRYQMLKSEKCFLLLLLISLGTWRTVAKCAENDLFSFNPGEGVPIEYLATLSVNPATAFRMLQDFVDLKEGTLSTLLRNPVKIYPKISISKN